MRTKNNILDNFKEQGISLITYSIVDYDAKLRVLLKHLANNSILITDRHNNLPSSRKYVVNEINIDIIDTLKQFNNQCVFISVPTGEWITPNHDYKYVEEKNFLEAIYEVSDKNDLSIILISYTYNSPNNTTNVLNIAPNSTKYMSNFIINYKNEMIHIVKNRFGSDNNKYHIDTMKELFVKEYREKKLKRILKIS